MTRVPRVVILLGMNNTHPIVTHRTKYSEPTEEPVGVAKTCAFALYPEQIALIKRAVEENREQGGHANKSQTVRWALSNTDWEEMPLYF